MRTVQDYTLQDVKALLFSMDFSAVDLLIDNPYNHISTSQMFRLPIESWISLVSTPECISTRQIVLRSPSDKPSVSPISSSTNLTDNQSSNCKSFGRKKSIRDQGERLTSETTTQTGVDPI